MDDTEIHVSISDGDDVSKCVSGPGTPAGDS